MDYYRICQDKRIPNQIRPVLPKLENRNGKPIFVRGVLESPREYAYFPPMIEDSVLMLSDPTKIIWECYQLGWEYYPCALGNIEQKRIQVYWIAEPKWVDGLSENTEYQKDGTIKKIVLSKNKVKSHKVFAFRNLHKTYYIADKEVIEKMLQEHIHGFTYERVETV